MVWCLPLLSDKCLLLWKPSASEKHYAQHCLMRAPVPKEVMPVSLVCVRGYLVPCGAPSSFASLTAQPCIQAVSQCWISSLTHWDTDCSPWHLCSLHFVVRVPQQRPDVHRKGGQQPPSRADLATLWCALRVSSKSASVWSTAGVLKTRIWWSGLHFSWREIWDLPCVCLLAGLLADSLCETWQHTRQWEARAFST